MKPIARPDVEIHHDSGSRLCCGDAGQVLGRWRDEFGDAVQTVYMDPPFMSGGLYRHSQPIGEQGWRGHRDFIRNAGGFSDRWAGGPEEYLEFMETVIIACRELIAGDGCLFLHVDWRAVADLRIILDRIFGRDHFVNEIIWSYQSGGRTTTHFSRKHDNILLYRKGKSFFFDPRPIGVPRGPERRNHMRRGVSEDGRVYYAIKTGGKEYRYYEDEPVFPGDVWTDISHLQQRDPERTGYETQKPAALLRRILLSTTREGDLVCDPFAGSGTTAAVAMAAGRRVLTCDRNPEAIHVTRRRMAETGRGFSVDLRDMSPAQTPAALTVDREPAGNRQRICLRSFSVAGAEKWRTPSLLPREDTLVDYWSVGRIHEGNYHIYDCEMRTPDRPSLSGTLILGGGPGIPALHIVDGLGGEHWYGEE